MSNQVLRCQECGRTDQSKFVFDPSGKFFTCACGAVNKLYDTYNITKIEGIATVDSRLRHIEQLLDDGNVDKADGLCKEILAIEPECYQAWWYRYLCASAVSAYYGYEDQFGRRDPHSQAQVRENNLRFADRAIQYAPEAIKSQYIQQSQQDRNYINNVRNGNMDQKTNGKSGCYIATAVYGSYSAPQVYTLRKFRDRVLLNSIPGRLFVRCYYRFGPWYIRRFGNLKRVNGWIRAILDRIVERLEQKWSV